MFILIVNDIIHREPLSNLFKYKHYVSRLQLLFSTRSVHSFLAVAYWMQLDRYQIEGLNLIFAFANPFMTRLLKLLNNYFLMGDPVYLVGYAKSQ